MLGQNSWAHFCFISIGLNARKWTLARLCFSDPISIFFYSFYSVPVHQWPSKLQRLGHSEILIRSEGLGGDGMIQAWKPRSKFPGHNEFAGHAEALGKLIQAIERYNEGWSELRSWVPGDYGSWGTDGGFNRLSQMVFWVCGVIWWLEAWENCWCSLSDVVCRFQKVLQWMGFWSFFNGFRDPVVTACKWDDDADQRCSTNIKVKAVGNQLPKGCQICPNFGMPFSSLCCYSCS